MKKLVIGAPKKNAALTENVYMTKKIVWMVKLLEMIVRFHVLI